MADSYYEYLLKQYLQAGGKNWEEAMEAAASSDSQSSEASSALQTSDSNADSSGLHLHSDGNLRTSV